MTTGTTEFGLGEVLKRYQSRYGPLRLDRFMRAANFHPRFGYYRVLDRGPSHSLEEKGDFVTAPALSQIFGELVALYIYESWRKQTHESRRPSPWTLLELGPGRGTLLKDVLRVLQNFPPCLASLRLEGLETNKHFQKQTEQGLQELRFSAPTRPPTIHWHPTLQSMGPRTEFYFILANEFFDCFPIRQFQRIQRHKARPLWQERYVQFKTAAPPGAPGEPLWRPVDDACSEQLEKEFETEDATDETMDGTLIEYNQEALFFCQTLRERFAKNAVAFLFCDYGAHQCGAHQTHTGDSLQAVAHHRYADFWANPGKHDLSAHVRFHQLARALQPCHLDPCLPLAAFLEQMGGRHRLKTLLASTQEEALRKKMRLGYERLVALDGMGWLFKVMTGAWGLQGRTPDAC